MSSATPQVGNHSHRGACAFRLAAEMFPSDRGVPASTGVGVPDVWGSRHDNAAADSLRPAPRGDRRSVVPGRHGAAVRIRLQVLEGRVSQSAAAGLAGGAPVPIDRAGAGLRRDLKLAGNGVFG